MIRAFGAHGQHATSDNENTAKYRLNREADGASAYAIVSRIFMSASGAVICGEWLASIL
jgi:hypothetical protein